MKDYDSLINFKWGSKPFGEKRGGDLSKRWFFYKPNTGNLSPAPQAPFSAFCSVPYSGGYPTGYGRYKLCTASSPRLACRNNLLKGITHFAPSGTGNVGNFYNYFLIAPTKRASQIVNEKYRLDGYELRTGDYSVNAKMYDNAVRYSIKSNEAVVLYPDFGGLSVGKLKPTYYGCEITSNGNCLSVIVDYKTITIYWAASVGEGVKVEVDGNRVILYGDSVDLTLGYSFKSCEDAKARVQNALNDNGNTVADKWREVLSAVDIKASAKVETLFYTALYHSMKRPFIYDNSGSVYDFATLWDMYKTQLPLAFLLYRDRASEILNGLLRLFSEDGYFCNSTLITNRLTSRHSEQCVCVANLLLSTAKLYGVPFDYEKALTKQLQDIEYQASKSLPRLPSFTHNLDLIDALLALEDAHANRQDKATFDRVKALLPTLFDDKGVLLKTDGAKYYEGSNINYSFRVSASTEERLKSTNKKELIMALDGFFGYGCTPCKYYNRYTFPNFVRNYGDKVRRFEGLNNEPDMETPYLYGLVDRHDRQNEVLNEIMNCQYDVDDGGLSGNDDTGGLSSWYVWNALGLFPITGTNRLLIGCPQIESATININEPFHIKVKKTEDSAIYLSAAVLNGARLNKYELTVQDVINGGELIVELTNRADSTSPC